MEVDWNMAPTHEQASAQCALTALPALPSAPRAHEGLAGQPPCTEPELLKALMTNSERAMTMRPAIDDFELLESKLTSPL